MDEFANILDSVNDGINELESKLIENVQIEAQREENKKLNQKRAQNTFRVWSKDLS